MTTDKHTAVNRQRTGQAETSSIHTGLAALHGRNKHFYFAILHDDTDALPYLP